MAAFAVFTTLLGVYSARLWDPYETGSNFSMYYTAACLVRSNMSVHIYDAVDRETNPEIIYANPNTVWAQTARAHGISRITLYLYPPTLADLLVPLTALSASKALIVWHALEVLMIVVLSAALTRLLDVRFFGSTILVSAAVLLFRPTLNTLHWGQASILLAFLMTVGFSLYVGGHKNAAALLFVLAIAIKLEPILVVVPLIAWRDWKCVRSMAIWGILLFLGLWAINGSDAMNLYFLHQLPTMSGGELGGSGDINANRSLGNVFYAVLGRGHSALSSRELGWLFRGVSVLILCIAGWLSRLKPGEKSTNLRQFEIGMIFLLLTCCLAPYSWFYNWGISAPVVVMFYKRAWDGRADIVETVLLIAFLLSLLTTSFHMPTVTPIIGVALGIFALYRMELERRAAENNNPIAQLKPVSIS